MQPEPAKTSEEARDSTVSEPQPLSSYELKRLRQVDEAVRSFCRILLRENGPDVSAVIQSEANSSAWDEGLLDEVCFWWGTIGAILPGYRMFAEDLVERRTPFQYTDLLSHFDDRTIRVLDVGSGPFTTLGTFWADHELNISLADPLANVFGKIREMFEITWNFESRACGGENLEKFYPLEHFHFVLARNSLDHSIDPLACIRQMLEVTRTGGVVLLRHYENEAEQAQHAGLHQWNFTEESGRAVIWNPSRKMFLDEELPSNHNISVTRETSIPRDGQDWTDNWIEIIIRKRAENKELE